MRARATHAPQPGDARLALFGERLVDAPVAVLISAVTDLDFDTVTQLETPAPARELRAALEARTTIGAGLAAEAPDVGVELLAAGEHEKRDRAKQRAHQKVPPRVRPAALGVTVGVTCTAGARVPSTMPEMTVPMSAAPATPNATLATSAFRFCSSAAARVP